MLKKEINCKYIEVLIWNVNILENIKKKSLFVSLGTFVNLFSIITVYSRACFYYYNLLAGLTLEPFW
jgi:hypothetical protein